MDTADVLLQRTAAEAPRTGTCSGHGRPLRRRLMSRTQWTHSHGRRSNRELAFSTTISRSCWWAPNRAALDRVSAGGGSATTPTPAPSTSPSAANASVSRCHLILGDSIAKHIQLPVPAVDSVLNLAKGQYVVEEKKVCPRLPPAVGGRKIY